MTTVIPVFDPGHFRGPEIRVLLHQEGINRPIDNILCKILVPQPDNTKPAGLNTYFKNKISKMSPQKFCQSCTLPMDNPQDHGTEKDGARSEMYCKYCYQNGAFTKPDMTLDQMMKIAETGMKKQNLPAGIIQQSMNMLPRLKRWNTNSRI